MINLNFFKKNKKTDEIIVRENNNLLSKKKDLELEIIRYNKLLEKDKLEQNKNKKFNSEQKNSLRLGMRICFKEIEDIKKKIEINNSLKNKE